MTTAPGPALAAELLRLELALARRDLASLPGSFGDILDDGFVELGQSGRRWDREAALELLGGDVPRAELLIAEFRVDRLSDRIALATYRLEGRSADGGRTVSLRSSVWVRSGDRWRLRFHQGTPVAPASRSSAQA